VLELLSAGFLILVALVISIAAFVVVYKLYKGER
jgi:hypothetical protein